MKILAALPALLMAAACAHGPMVTAGPAGDEAACDVLIRFDSACCGVDAVALAGVTRMVSGRPDVARATQWSMGREGEKRICLTTTSAHAADDIFAMLARHYYPPPGNHGYTTIVRKGRSAVVDRDER